MLRQIIHIIKAACACGGEDSVRSRAFFRHKMEGDVWQATTKLWIGSWNELRAKRRTTRQTMRRSATTSSVMCSPRTNPASGTARWEG